MSGGLTISLFNLGKGGGGGLGVGLVMACIFFFLNVVIPLLTKRTHGSKIVQRCGFAGPIMKEV